MYWKIDNSRYFVVTEKIKVVSWARFRKDGKEYRESLTGFIIDKEGLILDKLESYGTYRLSAGPLYNIHEGNIYESHVKPTGLLTDCRNEILYSQVVPCEKREITSRFYVEKEKYERKLKWPWHNLILLFVIGVISLLGYSFSYFT